MPQNPDPSFKRTGSAGFAILHGPFKSSLELHSIRGGYRMTCSALAAAVAAFAPVVVFAASDYGAWSKVNTDGQWTAAAESAVRQTTLPSSLPSDVARFCPTYASRSADERVQFWAGLLSAIARPESHFKPETKFTESLVDAQGKHVVSRGLLQLSIESANQKKYSCGIQKAEDLHDPRTNITCGSRILAAWVQTDGAIATYGAGPNRGGGRYWSTLQERRGHLPELTGFTKSLPNCREA